MLDPKVIVALDTQAKTKHWPLSIELNREAAD